MKLLLAASLLPAIVAVSDGDSNTYTCQETAPCLQYTVEKNDAAVCDSDNPGSCDFKICWTQNNSAAGCDMPSGTSFSHIGDMAKTDLCLNSEGKKGYWDENCNDNLQGEFGTVCQVVGPGKWAHFLTKKGSSCVPSDGSTDIATITDSSGMGTTAYCAPSIENPDVNVYKGGQTFFPPTSGGGNGGTCSGNSVGTECVFSVQAPTSCDGGASSSAQEPEPVVVDQTEALSPQEIPLLNQTDVYIVCGDEKRFCGWKDVVVAALEETHEVRCCSDDPIPGWTKKGGCDVYGESDLLPADGGTQAQCHHEATYAEAVNICKANNARLCTRQELLDRCTVGTGCGHDRDHVWSSTISTGEVEATLFPIQPLTLPEGSKVYLACGDHKNSKGCGKELHTNVAELTETHELRCCSDVTRSGWTKRNGCNVWGESELYGEDGARKCHDATTFAEGAKICAMNGGRLCTKQEVLGRCTRGSGCGHDRDLVWTSSVAPENALATAVSGLETQSQDTAVCLGPTGTVSGDPHVKTFDGLRYDCQGKGEFVLAMSKGSDPLRIHGRFVGGDWKAKPTVTRSVAMKVDEAVPVVHVTVPDQYDEDVGCPYSFSIGSQEEAIPSNEIISYFEQNYSGKANVYTNGRSYVFTYPGYGARIEVSVKKSSRNFGCVMRTNVCLTPEKHGGVDNIVGLLGSPNGDKNDDWMESSQGSAIVTLPPLDNRREVMKQGHDYCVANWCVGSSGDSLYGVDSFNTYNKCPDSSFDADLMLQVVDSLAPEVVTKCQDTEDSEGCAMDVALEVEGTDLDPLVLVNDIVESELEMSEIRTLTEQDLDGGVGDWAGPKITTARISASVQDLPLVDGKDVFVVCGDEKRFCGSKDVMVATLGERHEVRCCSDDPIDGWKYHSRCNVYAESDLFAADGENRAQCHHDTTYAEAVNICKANNARLCTKQELLDRCTVGSGCGHDRDHIWTSTIATQADKDMLAPEPVEPLVLPEGSRVYLACGDHKNNKGCGGVLHANVAELTESHEVRCCSDVTISGWTKRNGCNVWGQSELLGEDGMEKCHHATTFDEASKICALNGARLCTKQEVLGRCTRGSGCGHDRDLVWTSSVAPEDAVAVVYKAQSQLTSEKICLGPTGTVSGDPHVKTFDGLKYDCQGKGEFVLAMSKNSSDPLRIHGRFVGGDWKAKPTVTRSVAMKVVKDVPVIHVTVPDEYDEEDGCPYSFTVGGEEEAIPVNEVITYFEQKYAGKVNVYTNGKNYVFTYPEIGARLEVSVKKSGRNFGCVMRTAVCLTPEKHGGVDNIVGLLGSPNGNKQDDWMESSQDGGIVPIPEGNRREIMKQGHDYCVANWCVGSSDDSLYGVDNFNTYNKCPESSFDPDLMLEVVENLPPEVAANCQDTEDAEGCAMDVALEVVDTDEDPLAIVEEIVQDDIEAAEIRELAENDLDGTVGDWIGPKLTTTSSNLISTSGNNNVASSCPPSVELIHVNGVTSPPAGMPIEILEQNTNSVKFSVKSAFTSTVNTMFVRLEENASNGDSKCYSEETVQVDDSLEYTAYCHEGHPFSVVHVWVSDPTALEAGQDDAEVPRCCHRNPEDQNPTVQYTFLLRCTDPCPDDEQVVEDRKLATKKTHLRRRL